MDGSDVASVATLRQTANVTVRGLSTTGFVAWVGAAALAAILLPLHALLVAPILFGVPHVLGDVRALVLQKPGGFGGTTALASLAALGVMTALRAATKAGAQLPPQLELGVGVLAVLLAILVGSRASRRRTLALSAALTLGGIALAFPRISTLVLAHAHNFIALLLWLVVARGPARTRASLLAYTLALAAVLLVPHFGPDALGEFRWSELATTLAPGLDTNFSDRVIRSFAFAQLVHYTLWCGPLPLAKGTAFASEVGRTGVALAIFACVALPLAGLLDAPAARSTYLSIAIAHGWLELAVLGFLVSRGKVRA